MEDSESIIVEKNGWTVRVREPEGEGPHPVLLLVHGWTGDENSMWIFARRLPKKYLLLAPRGLYTTSFGGYGWQSSLDHVWPKVEDFLPTVNALIAFFTADNFPGGDFSRLRMAGFSQGAALIYTWAMLHPERIISLAGLAGFLPENASELAGNKPLRGIPVFAAHGDKDERVPVERARAAVDTLELAGAQVTYCEDHVGHKLSLTCFQKLEDFFAVY